MTYSWLSSVTAFLSPDRGSALTKAFGRVDASYPFPLTPGRPLDRGSHPVCVDAYSRTDDRRDHARSGVALMRFERTPEFSGSRDDDGTVKPVQCPECGSKKFGTLHR